MASLIIALLVLPHPSIGAPANGGKPLRDIVLTMPAETVLASLKKVLPLTIPSQSSQLQGQIVLESLDKLSIHDNILSIKGVLSGKNMVVVTNIAGQDVQLKLGQVTLPMTCDLATRFDQARRKLFVTPRFPQSNLNPGSQEASLGSLPSVAGSTPSISTPCTCSTSRWAKNPFPSRCSRSTSPARTIPWCFACCLRSAPPTEFLREVRHAQRLSVLQNHPG